MKIENVITYKFDAAECKFLMTSGVFGKSLKVSRKKTEK
jgi:hypothetical protein